MIYSKNMHDTAIGKYDLGVQSVYTPVASIEKVTNISFINFISNDIKEICVLFNTEFFEYFLEKDYIKNNNVHVVFGYDCQYDFDIANRVSRLYKYNNVEFIDLTAFSKSKNVKDIVKAMGQRKFDFVFSNPPYNKNLDLKILQVLFNCAKNIVFIHPSCFVIDKKFAQTIYNDIRNTKFCVYLNMFWGNKMFDIDNQTPLCISAWNTTKKTEMIDFVDNVNNEQNICSINDISIIGKKYFELKNFITTDTLNKHTGEFIVTNVNGKFHKTYKSNNKYGICLPLIASGNTEDYFFYLIKNNPNKQYLYDKEDVDFTRSSINKNGESVKMGGMSDALVFWFNTIEERKNFIGYIKTKFARIMLATIKSNLNLNVKDVCNIPWMDFTHSWNDKDLCKEFNISKELWQYIDKFIPDYYNDYKSGF